MLICLAVLSVGSQSFFLVSIMHFKLNFWLEVCASELLLFVQWVDGNFRNLRGLLSVRIAFLLFIVMLMYLAVAMKELNGSF